jgi:hypothetical protein
MSVTHGHVLASCRRDREAEVRSYIRPSPDRDTHSYRQTGPVGIAHWGMTVGLLSHQTPAPLTAATHRAAVRQKAVVAACQKAVVVACQKAVVAACQKAAVAACHMVDWGGIAGSAGCPCRARCKAPGCLYSRQNNHRVVGHCYCRTVVRSCDLRDWLCLGSPQCHSWSGQEAAFALRAIALTCGFAIPGACHSKRCALG